MCRGSRALYENATARDRAPHVSTLDRFPNIGISETKASLERLVRKTPHVSIPRDARGSTHECGAHASGGREGPTPVDSAAHSRFVSDSYQRYVLRTRNGRIAECKRTRACPAALQNTPHRTLEPRHQSTPAPKTPPRILNRGLSSWTLKRAWGSPC